MGLALRLARQWWPQLLALAAACGVVATTIAGGLAVGDAMQDGLATLAVERLGRIDAAVAGRDFFTAGLADATRRRGGRPAAARAGDRDAGGGRAARGRRGPDHAAGLRRSGRPRLQPAPPPLAPGGLLANPPLAEALGLAAGEDCHSPAAERSSVPADSPLGRRTGESAGRRLNVTAVLPPRGIGQFSLRPVQVTAPLAVTSLAEARRILRRDDAANVLFAVGMAADGRRRSLAPRRLDPGRWPTTAWPSSRPPTIRQACG